LTKLMPKKAEWEYNHTCPTPLDSDTKHKVKRCTELHGELAALLTTVDEEGYNIDLTHFDVEKIARKFREFCRLEKDLIKSGFEQYMSHDAGTCWNDVEIWAEDIAQIKEDFEYIDSEAEDESEQSEEDESEQSEEAECSQRKRHKLN